MYYSLWDIAETIEVKMMAERGWGFIEFAVVGLSLMLIGGVLGESKEILESIDEKMHTHAADGSINGIRGWY